MWPRLTGQVSADYVPGQWAANPSPRATSAVCLLSPLSISVPLDGLPILLGHSGVPLFLGETYSREAHGTHYSAHCCGRSQGLLPLLSVWGPLSLSHHLCSLDVSLGGMTQTLIAEGSCSWLPCSSQARFAVPVHG